MRQRRIKREKGKKKKRKALEVSANREVNMKKGRFLYTRKRETKGESR